MSLLFETICVRNGIPERLALHAARMNSSRRSVLGCTDEIDLVEVLSGQSFPAVPLARCRVDYGRKVTGVVCVPYRLREIRSLEIVTAEDLRYDHKFADRTALDRLVAASRADDIVIVREGYVTDASFANLVFVGRGGWSTPSTPLLRGTRRAHLLAQGLIREDAIREEEIGRYTHVMLVNAMRGPDPAGAIPITSVCRRGSAA